MPRANVAYSPATFTALAISGLGTIFDVYGCKSSPLGGPMSLAFNRILKGSGASAMALMARTFEQLFLVPILLSAWSVDLYGEWLLVSAIPIYFSMSDLGFLQAGSNELARRASQEKEEGVKRFFTEYTASFTGYSILFFAVFCMFTAVIPLNKWLGLSIMTPSETFLTFLSLVAGAMISMNSNALMAGLRVKKLFHIGLLIRAISAYVRVIATFIAVFYLHFGPVGVALLNATFRGLEYAACSIPLYRRSLPPSFAIFSKRQERLLPYLFIGMEYLLMPLAYSFSLQGITLVVGTIAGTAAVAVFTTHRTLARMITSSLQMFAQPFRAEAGLMQKKDDIPLLASLLMRLSSITFWLSISVTVPLLIFGDMIFSYWTHGNIAFHYELFALLLFTYVLEGIWRIASSIRLGSNRHRPIVWGYSVISILGLALAVILGKISGLNGIALSTLLTSFAMCVLTVKVTVTLIEMSAVSYLLNILRPPLSDMMGLIRIIKKRLKMGVSS
ncbi:lipopolysaccharide biosynthesis protein [Martelella mangrovi]|uniref:O-antigen/teichoic acid export membrane protein n=1 Tax=Martelella mangrovi TaxID=1397477 RepID=A0ABV2I8C4_9HYPH